MKICMDVNATRLSEMTYGCDELWDIVWNQSLENRLDQFLDDYYNGEPADFGRLNDLLRYETKYVLEQIGADLTGTIYED